MDALSADPPTPAPTPEPSDTSDTGGRRVTFDVFRMAVLSEAAVVEFFERVSAVQVAQL